MERGTPTGSVSAVYSRATHFMYNISIQMFRKNKEHGNANGYITQYKTPRSRLNLKLLLFLERKPYRSHPDL